MRRPALWTLALCALLSCVGCYTGSPYVRPRASLGVDRAGLLAAVQEIARAQGLRVLRVQPDPGLVVAVTPADRLGEVSMREHWNIFVQGGAVSVEMHPEMKLEGEANAVWERDTRVCGCYHYAREQELLHALRARFAVRRGASRM